MDEVIGRKERKISLLQDVKNGSEKKGDKGKVKGKKLIKDKIRRKEVDIVLRKKNEIMKKERDIKNMKKEVNVS